MSDTQHDDTPRRLTPTERLHEITLAAFSALTRRGGSMQRDSITTTRNAKADVQFEVVTYRQEDELEDDFAARHEARHDRLEAKYAPSPAQEHGRKAPPDA